MSREEAFEQVPRRPQLGGTRLPPPGPPEDILLLIGEELPRIPRLGFASLSDAP